MAKMKFRGIDKQLYNYMNEDEDIQAMCREYVFNIYLANCNENYYDALDNITADIVAMEHLEEYERCYFLNDILKEFA